LRIAPSQPNSTAMRALRNQTPIQISDTETDFSFAPFRPRSRAEGFRSVLTIPLLTQHAPSAALLLYKSEPYRYGYSELELASSFANHATIAMENAALYERSDERLREQTRQFEAIVESLNDGLILESAMGEVLYCNWQAAKLAQTARRDAMRQNGAALLDQLLAMAKDRETVVADLNAVKADTGDRMFDFTRKLEDGRSQDLRLHFFDVTDAQGNLIGRGQLWQDITSDKELDRMKSALLSTVSHELRTPLAAIKGYASTLLADDVEWDAASQREFLQTISDETDRLTLLVENLLDMSRLEAGMLLMNRQPHMLEDLIEPAVKQVCDTVAPWLSVRLSPDIPSLWVDVSRMETVVRNLLENAVKYSPPNTEIELTAHRENGRVIIQVRDYGPGIPDALHDKIFDRFYRADSRFTARVRGAGLGLAICKGFVEAHGGDIWVANGAPGTIIGFSLPIDD
ncbi:MAG: GAF domain-containing protein, partial [Chloroflexi bacterium]|nr:GAF domain-containing protein [Chloroflexota bacterium]